MVRSHGISAIRFVKARGFSLLELMVALAILAIVATSVYSRSGDAAVQLHGLERRTLGRWGIGSKRFGTDAGPEACCVG